MRSALIASFILLTGCSTAMPGMGGEASGLAQFVRADVVRAKEIAAASSDPAGVECADAILAALPAESVSLAPAGAFSAFMAARELRRKVNTGVDETVHAKCAVLVLDASMTLARLGLLAVPGGGAASLLLRR